MVFCRLFSTLALILIQNIVSKGSSAFSRTTISVDISFDSKLLEIDGPITKINRECRIL